MSPRERRQLFAFPCVSSVSRKLERDQLGSWARPGRHDDVLFAAMHVSHRCRGGEGVELNRVQQRPGCFVEDVDQLATVVGRLPAVRL